MNNIIQNVIKVLNNEVAWLFSEIRSHPSDSPSFCSSRPGVYEVQQLSGGARHAAVLTGKSVPPPSLRPLLLCSSAHLIYQVHLECSKSEWIVSQPTPYLSAALPCLHFRVRSVPRRVEGNRREGISGSKYWFEGQGWSTCLHHL